MYPENHVGLPHERASMISADAIRGKPKLDVASNVPLSTKSKPQ
jgi:hypothetical protein